MAGRINPRSVIKTVPSTYARAFGDSDAFILPDYTRFSPAWSHHRHTSGIKRARSPLGRGLFFFPLQSSSRSRAFSDWLIYFIFFYPGGLRNIPPLLPTPQGAGGWGGTGGGLYPPYRSLPSSLIAVVSKTEPNRETTNKQG